MNASSNPITLEHIAPVATGSGPTLPLLVDEREAARLLGVSPRTVWELAHRGELPRVLIGRAVRYRVLDLHDFCARRAGTKGDAK